MMATVQDLKAYLDWQSEMGTDEVILPGPWSRKQAASDPTSPRGSAPDRPSIGTGAPGGPHGLSAKGTAGAGPANPAHEGSRAESFPREAAPHATGPHGNGYPREGASDPAEGGLYESLSKALESANASKSAGIILPSAPAAGTSPIRASEAHNLPAFAGLNEFWEYLDKRPHLLHGEASETAGLPVARTVRSAGPAGASLGLIGFGPSDADAAEGAAFRGEAGALLEKMMRAIKLDAAALYMGHLLKVKVPGKAWSRRELARIVPLLHAELALARVPMVLLLGQECAQAVLKTGKTLDELRQETHRQEGREFFVTYHPEELLRKEELKRKAWEDLQWLQRRMAEKART
jgi:DNA polymerase